MKGRKLRSKLRGRKDGRTDGRKELWNEGMKGYKKG